MRRIVLRASAGLAGGAAVGVLLAQRKKSQLTGPAIAEPAALPGIEVLVHNIGHSDLILQLQADDGDEVYRSRPRFNQFQPVTSAILGYMDGLQARAAARDRRARGALTQFCARAQSEGVRTEAISCMSKYQVRYPIGLDLQVGSVHGAQLGSIRVPSEGGSGHDQPAANPWERFHLKGFRRHDGTTPDLPQARHAIARARARPARRPLAHDARACL